MTRIQYLLGKLAEEAAEIAQIALKTQQFGVDEVYQNGPSNIERVNIEYNDLLAIARLINEHIGDNVLIADNVAIEQKMGKVKYYYNYAISLGQVQDDTEQLA